MRRFPSRQRAMVAALRDARKAAGLSQRALSAKLGEPSNFIQRVESLERDLSVAEFIEIVRTIGADPMEVFGRIVGR